MIVQAVPDWKKPEVEKNWGRMLAFSLGLHLLLVVFFFQLVPRGRTISPLEAAYTVNLISPGEGPAGGPAAPPAADPIPHPTPAKPVSPKPKEIPPPRVADPVPLPSPAKLVSPKPKEVPPTKAVEKLTPPRLDDSQSLDKALEKIKKKIDQEKSLERSFHQLENKVKNQEALGQALARLERKQAKAEKAGGNPAVRGEGGNGITASAVQPGSAGVGMQFQIYHAALRSRIKKNWFLPEGLLKKTNISADILVRIAQNGKIEETRFERKSGNETFDQEVLRTLKKSEPLPPLPEGYPRSSYEVVLTFHSEDLGGH
jgi:colicin import membrane protein